METMETTTTKKFTLPNKKIMVVPVRRKGRWLPDNHEASFLFKESYVSLVVPRQRRTGQLVDPLTPEEREYFESKESGLALKKDDLSIYKKTDNYWSSFRVKLDKNVTILDLANPEQYLQYKVLLTNKDIVAPSMEEKFMKGTYRFAIGEEGWEVQDKANQANDKREAYKAFGKLTVSPTKMRDFLNVYYSLHPGGKSIPPTASREFLEAEIEKIIESKMKEFTAVYNDEQYEEKVTVYKALQAGAIERDNMTYKLPEGTVIGDNMGQVVAWMANPKNSDEVMRIKARIETNS